MDEKLPLLLDLLGSGEDMTRLHAAKTLEDLLKEELEHGRSDWEPLAQQLTPALIHRLSDRVKGVQVHAANCLEFLAYQSELVLPALRTAMGGAHRQERWLAALIAARLGLWLPEMSPALEDALGAEDRDLRWAAAHLSVRLCRTHQKAVPMILQSLKSPNPTARRMAAYCLGALECDAAVVQPLRDSLGSAPALEQSLVAALTDADPTVRRAALLALHRLRSLSPAALERMAALQADPDPFVRRTATAVCGRLRS